MFRGIILCASIGCISFFTAKYTGAIGSVTIALLIGMLTGNIIKTINYSEGIKFSEKKILPAAIALMGTGVNFQVFSRFGIRIFFVIISIIAVTILSGFLISRLFGTSKKTGLLLGIGNAVCGSSAIMASAQVIKPEKEETAITVGTVNLLGIIGIFTAPAIAGFMNYNDFQSGIVIGGSIQAVGQVVASGFSVSDQVGQYSTIIKMYRVLMLGFVILGLQIYMNRAENRNGNFMNAAKVPFFITAFFILAILSSLGVFPELVLKAISVLDKSLMLTAMAAIGLSINLRAFIYGGGKVLTAGILNSAFQILFIITILKVVNI